MTDPRDQVIEVIVSIEAPDGEAFTECLDHLRAAGLRVESIQDFLGTVTGFVRLGSIRGLAEIECVGSVEPVDLDIQLPPPDASIQ